MKRIHLSYLLDHGKLFFLVTIILLSCSAKDGELESQRRPLSGSHYGGSDQISQVVRMMFQDSKGNLWFGTQNGAFKLQGDSLVNIGEIKGQRGNPVTIKDIVEDKGGVIWFGHTDGVSSLDGDAVTNYYESDGLISNDVWCLEATRDGKIWIGTIKGACVFDGHDFTPFALPEGTIDTTLGVSSAQMVHSIMEDSQGRMWFCTNAGLLSFTRNTDSVSSLEGIETSFVNDIIEDGSSGYWISTSVGLYYLKGGMLVNVSRKHFDEPTGTGSMVLTSSGDLWFNCRRDIYKLSGDSLCKYRIADGDFGPLTFQIFEDQKKHLWFVGYGGVYRMEDQAFINVTRQGPW
jgi:ligand-binding sensor domain-containing protein